MSDLRKQKLIELGVEKIADILLDFSCRYDEIDDCVNWLVAPPDKKLSLVKSKISRLRKFDDFIDWRHASDFERGVENILDDIKSLNPDPKTGLSLTADFFRTDRAVIDGCHSDTIGDVYSVAAVIFAEFARHCNDKTMVMDLILELIGDDAYGVRDDILKHAGKFLSKTDMKTLCEQIKKKFGASESRLNLAELARQMKDVALFVRLNSDPATGEVYRPQLIPIAQLCFDCGKYQEALEWLKKIPHDDYIPSGFKKKLLAKLGMNKELEALCRKSFFACPSPESLKELLQVIGRDKKAEIIADALTRFVAEEQFSEASLNFLLTYGTPEIVSNYVIARWEKVDGRNYMELNELWPELKKISCPLAASIILRALLNSILERKNTKSYYYGARYWHELTNLALEIEEWHDLPPHEQYCDEIRNANKRKKSFWMEVGKI